MENTIILEELKECSLIEHRFFNDTVSMQLPTLLKELPADEDQGSFVGSIKPQNVFSSSQNDVFFSISQTEMNSEISSMEDFLGQQRSTLSQIVPGYRELGSGIKDVNGIAVGCVQYMAKPTEKDLINIFFTFVNNGSVKHGVLVAPYEWQEMWTMIFLTCIETLQLTKGNHKLK